MIVTLSLHSTVTLNNKGLHTIRPPWMIGEWDGS